MGTYSDWLTHNIPDPTVIDANLYLALSALDTVIDELSSAEYISFSYDSFYSGVVTTVGEALRELADYLVSAAATRRLVTIPSYGSALVDATVVFSMICNRAGVLGMSYTHLYTAPAAAPTVLQILKNASTMYELSFAIGENGPKEVDLSFISVVAGDIISIKCITASSAAGLSFTMEY